MKAVTPEEAKTCLERLQLWAKKPSIPSTNNEISEKIFEPISKDEKNYYVELDEDETIDNLWDSLTQGAVQRDWRTPTEFLCCPQNTLNDPIKEYARNLKKGKVFSKNQYAESTVIDFSLSENDKILYVITENKETIKPYALAKITYENNLFAHSSMGTYFELVGAEKQFVLTQGREWTGGDSIDDYC